jgi:hypothetical protein
MTGRVWELERSRLRFRSKKQHLDVHFGVKRKNDANPYFYMDSGQIDGR